MFSKFKVCEKILTPRKFSFSLVLVEIYLLPVLELGDVFASFPFLLVRVHFSRLFIVLVAFVKKSS